MEPIDLQARRPWHRAAAWRITIGHVLRAARRDQGLRLTDVADRAGMSPQYLSEVERGRKEASSQVLSALTRALGLTLVDLAGALVRELPEPAAAPSRERAARDLSGVRHEESRLSSPAPVSLAEADPRAAGGLGPGATVLLAA